MAVLSPSESPDTLANVGTLVAFSVDLPAFNSSSVIWNDNDLFGKKENDRFLLLSAATAL